MVRPEDSSTYQAILQEGRHEGRIAEARRWLFRYGIKRLGEPDAANLAILEAILDLDRLEALGEGILDFDIQDWDGLLARPSYERALDALQMAKRSTTYQAILQDGRTEGRVAEARRLLHLLGTKRFGEPDATILARLEAVQDLDRLEALGERIFDFAIRTWNGLLGTV
jgi:hypothetical protein